MFPSPKKGTREDYFSDDGGEFLSDDETSISYDSVRRREVDIIEECEHSFINDFGFCEDCGMRMEVSDSTFKNEVGYSEFHSKTAEIVTYDEVFSLTIPQEVKEKSIALLNQKGTMSTRSLIHKQEIFIAVMRAYLKLIAEGKEYDIPYDESLLLKEIGLKLKHRTQISNYLSGLAKTSLPIAEDANIQIIVISPVQYISRDCEKNKLSDHTERIKTFAKRIIEKDRLGYILQDNPKHMSLAFIKLYLEKVRRKNSAKFGKANSISDGMLKTKMDVILSVIEEYDLKDELFKPKSKSKKMEVAE